MLKVIFLDIDGVLNSQLYYKSDRFNKARQEAEAAQGNRFGWEAEDLDTLAIEYLNELLTKSGSKVVISSVWRMSHTQEELQKLLNYRGFTGELIGCTPRLGEECVRGNEIRQWIKKNEARLGCRYSDYSSYIIFDDDSDMLLQQQPNFLLVDGYVGLTPNLCYKALHRLGGTT